MKVKFDRSEKFQIILGTLLLIASAIASSFSNDIREAIINLKNRLMNRWEIIVFILGIVWIAYVILKSYMRNKIEEIVDIIIKGNDKHIEEIYTLKKELDNKQDKREI